VDGCAEHGNSGKHEQANGLLGAAVERHRVFSVTSGDSRLEECGKTRRLQARLRSSWRQPQF
jgi:hypothetical protein